MGPVHLHIKLSGLTSLFNSVVSLIFLSTIVLNIFFVLKLMDHLYHHKYIFDCFNLSLIFNCFYLFFSLIFNFLFLFQKLFLRKNKQILVNKFTSSPVRYSLLLILPDDKADIFAAFLLIPYYSFLSLI